MILDANNAMHAKTKIFDCRGTQIGCVQRYDTESKEITMALPFGVGDTRIICSQDEEGQVGVKLVTFTLEGSYAEDENGNRL